MASHYLPRHNEGNQSPHASLIGEDNIDLNQWAICPDFQFKEIKSIIGNAQLGIHDFSREHHHIRVIIVN